MNIRKKIDPQIIGIIKKLQQSGFETYLVGGAVRDFLLNREPKDYDISTSATPEQIRDVFGRRRARIIGRRFRLVHLYSSNGYDVTEISTFRKKPANDKNVNESADVLISDIITDDNEYGTALEDAWRRDFTVNSLYYDPVTEQTHDFTALGLTDLKSGIVRTLGDPTTRFNEDPVRILRALKLVGQYGFKIEYETEKALIENLHAITYASISRLTLELIKILNSHYSVDIIKAMRTYGLLHYFLPYLDKIWKSDEMRHALNLMMHKSKHNFCTSSNNALAINIALLSISIVNAEFNPGYPEITLYKSELDPKKQIRKIIKKIFQPYHFPKFIVAIAADAIYMQSKLSYSKKSGKRSRGSQMYCSRELANVFNSYWEASDKPFDSK